MLLWVAVIGCGASSTERTAPLVVEAPLAVTPADADAAMVGLGGSVDPSRGVLVVARLEDASDGEAPPMVTSGLRCTPRDIDALGALLSDYLSERRSMDAPTEWRCAQDRCELRGMMEFDPTRVLRFARDAQGGLVVIGIDFFEDVGPEYVDSLRTEIDREHAARSACP